MIREEVTQIVGYELDDPRVASVTVTDVRVTENLRDASVYFTVEGTDEEKKGATAALKRAAPYVRRQLGMSLNLKYTPEIHFVRDSVEESAARVEELLTQIEQEARTAPPAGGAADSVEEGDESKAEG